MEKPNRKRICLKSPKNEKSENDEEKLQTICEKTVIFNEINTKEREKKTKIGIEDSKWPENRKHEIKSKKEYEILEEKIMTEKSENKKNISPNRE